MVQVCVMHVHRRMTHMAIDNIFVYFLSQCRTAVPHCCKGDAASQWETAILGVSELRNALTDRLKI